MQRRIPQSRITRSRHIILVVAWSRNARKRNSFQPRESATRTDDVSVEPIGRSFKSPRPASAQQVRESAPRRGDRLRLFSLACIGASPILQNGQSPRREIHSMRLASTEASSLPAVRASALARANRATSSPSDRQTSERRSSAAIGGGDFIRGRATALRRTRSAIRMCSLASRR